MSGVQPKQYLHSHLPTVRCVSFMYFIRKLWPCIWHQGKSCQKTLVTLC